MSLPGSQRPRAWCVGECVWGCEMEGQLSLEHAQPLHVHAYIHIHIFLRPWCIYANIHFSFPNSWKSFTLNSKSYCYSTSPTAPLSVPSPNSDFPKRCLLAALFSNFNCFLLWFWRHTQVMLDFQESKKVEDQIWFRVHLCRTVYLLSSSHCCHSWFVVTLLFLLRENYADRDKVGRKIAWAELLPIAFALLRREVTCRESACLKWVNSWEHFLHLSCGFDVVRKIEHPRGSEDIYCIGAGKKR